MARQLCSHCLSQTYLSRKSLCCTGYHSYHPTTSRSTVSSRTIAIASAVTSVATIGVMHMSQASPHYEGSIQMLGILPPDDSSPESSPSSHQPIPATQMAQTNIAPPDLIEAIDTAVINNRKMAHTVSQKLSQQGIAINSSTLLRHLSAQTTPQGWLDVRYADIEPSRVQLVLKEVGQWYASQDSKCESQACDDVLFIASQVPILEQQQQQLVDKITTLKNSLHQKKNQANITTNLDAHTEQLFVQQHKQNQRIAHVKMRMDEVLQQLDTYQTQMNLSHVQTKTGVALLRTILPQYDTWLNEWKKRDRQRLALILDSSLPDHQSERNVANRPGHIPQQSQPNYRLSQGTSSVSDQTPSEQLLSQQRQLQDEMNQTIYRLVNQPLNQIPKPIYRLILEDVNRFDLMEEWLLTLHRLQLLEARRHSLEEMQQATTHQVQQWQEAIATHTQLQRELNIVTGTLSAYQTKYQSAQHKAAQETLTWEVVSPPTIVQQPKEWIGPWAKALQRSRRLVTVR